MQNDRGRCYRYCAIGERHRCDGSARPTIFGFLSRGVLPRTSLRRVKRSDVNRSNREKKDKTSQCTLTVSAGAYVVSYPALSDPVRSPRYLPRSRRPIYIRWIATLAPGLAGSSPRSFWCSLWNVHCDVRAEVRRRSRGIVDCGIDTEDRDGWVSE